MRRDYFTLDAANVDSEGVPTVHIEFEGPDGQLRERLTHGGSFLDAEELDVTYRLTTPVDDEDATGVVAVTNRLTGEYVLELNAAADDVLRFISAAREREADDGEGRYHVEVTVDGEPLVSYEKHVFLVYDADGGLLRGRSLIPSGVEL